MILDLETLEMAKARQNLFKICPFVTTLPLITVVIII